MYVFAIGLSLQNIYGKCNRKYINTHERDAKTHNTQHRISRALNNLVELECWGVVLYS